MSSISGEKDYRWAFFLIVGIEDKCNGTNGTLELEVHVRGQCEHEEWIIRCETVYFVRNSTVISLCSSLHCYHVTDT